MSPRRWFGGALLLAALGMTSAPGHPSGTGVIVARVGGNLAGRVGDTLNVPITVDMTGSGGARLGSYRLTVRWNPNVLRFQTGSNGTFAQPFVNEDSAFAGVLRMTAIQPSGADSIVTLGVGHFVVQSDTGASDITLTVDEMSGIAPTFDHLLPYVTVVNATFCHAAGRWGDVDGDGQSNSRDALVALSRVVGIAIDTIRVETTHYPDSIHVDTVTTLRPGLADVDADGQVTSRDALIIMSYAVGLPVTGFRIGLAAAPGACGSGLGITLAIAPDTLELQSGQTAAAVVSARDGAGAPVSLNGATWTSGNTAVAGVASPGFGIVARDPGVAILTVQLGAGYRASMVVKVLAHRTQWYVDVARSQAALQTGSQAFPFAFIQDAFDAGRDGDTVRVASGTYEEMVSSDISVYLRGDPANWPVIDSRGSPSYYSHDAGLYAGSRAAPMRIENLRVEHGQITIYARGFAARNVHVEGIDSAGLGAALYFASLPGGPRGDTGSVTLDSVTVHGYTANGIEIDLADSVTIRNSAVSRDSTTFSACYGTGAAGIYVNAAAHTDITHTTVLSAPCVGIGVDQQGGDVRFSRNTVDRAAWMGIAANGDSIAFDHNVVTRIISGSSEDQAGGLVVINETTARSVTSLGDVVVNSGDRGVILMGARDARIDSLTVTTTGLDNTNSSAGVEFWGGHLTLTNSRIGNIFGNGIESYDALSTTLVGNTIDSATSNGVYISRNYGNSVLVVDSNHIANSGQLGLEVYCYFCTGSGTVTRNSILNNDTAGIYGDGSSASFTLAVHRNNIVGNVAAGAKLATAAFPGLVIDADTNFWGDSNGPTCDSIVGGGAACNSTAGDSVVSLGISFADWLVAPATDAMPAPRFLAPVARRAMPVALAGRPASRLRPSASLRPARATGSAHPFALRAPAAVEPRPRSPLMSWRKGQQPRPARVHHPS